MVDVFPDPNISGMTLYYLFSLERVSLAGGVKYFGTHDWFAEGGRMLLDWQQAEGYWPGGLAEGQAIGATSFALLFLQRGRAPVLFNKLQHGGDWNNRPRALAHFCRWASQRFETPLNWQIIHPDVPVEKWHDAPILVLTGSRAPKLTDAQAARLRDYVYQGGTIFTVAEGSGKEFTDGIKELYAKIFPAYELAPVPRDHPLETLNGDLHGEVPFLILSNGLRPLAIHTTRDLTMDWQFRRSHTRPESFQAGANLFLYVLNKQPPRNRGVCSWPPTPPAGTPKGMPIVRVRYAGNCDPEPLALQRLAGLMAIHAGSYPQLLPAVDAKDLPGCGAKVAFLTGTGRLTLTAEQEAGLKQFIAAGGTVVIDSAGGGEAFHRSAVGVVESMFGAGAVTTPSPEHALYNHPGCVIDRARYRRATLLRTHNTMPRLQAVTRDGRLAVLLSREDLTAGLAGYESYTVDGYSTGPVNDPGSAFQIVRNIFLYAGKQNAQPKPK